MKRCLRVFLDIFQALVDGDWPYVRGLVAQAIRWMVLFLYVPGKPC